MEIRPRLLRFRVEEALDDTPVVAIAGPRQAGKSTLAESVVRERGGAWVSLDDDSALAQAQSDPSEFVLRGGSGLLGIDEAQRAPELLLAIKASVDRDRRPGRFLLTGSTRLLGAARLADSLAGRMETLTLLPMTQAELSEEAVGTPTFLDRCFAGEWSALSAVRGEPRSRVLDRVRSGGFVPALDRSAGRRRDAWYLAYVEGVTDREVRQLADVVYARDLARLVRLVAARTAGELNVTDVARDLGLTRATTDTYLAHLEGVFLAHLIPAWSHNLTSRVVKRSKVALVDTGLAASLIGARAAADDAHIGRLLETFVLQELRAALTWGEVPADLFHFRDRDGLEVDIVVEAHDGAVIGIEVKAATTVRSGDLRGLKVLRDRLGHRFAGGVVLGTGQATQTLGDRLWSLPVTALWAATLSGMRGGT